MCLVWCDCVHVHALRVRHSQPALPASIIVDVMKLVSVCSTLAGSLFAVFEFGQNSSSNKAHSICAVTPRVLKQTQGNLCSPVKHKLVCASFGKQKEH